MRSPAPLLAEGVKAEEAYAKDGTLPDPASTDNPEFQIVLGLIRDGLAKVRPPPPVTALSTALSCHA